MSDKTKKQFINEYFDLKEAFLKEKEVNFINHEPLDFEFKLSDLMSSIEKKYNLNTTKNTTSGAYKISNFLTFTHSSIN
jgi:hypothetical protein